MNIDGVETYCRHTPLEIWKYVEIGEVWEDTRDGTRVVIDDCCNKHCKKDRDDHLVIVQTADRSRLTTFRATGFIKHWRKARSPSRA